MLDLLSCFYKSTFFLFNLFNLNLNICTKTCFHFIRGAAVEVKNKKGNSPLWLAANGGHLSVVEMLHNSGADIDSQDNRKVY